MRVFVTGATGFIGSAIVKELINAGHQVLGLARTEESAKGLIAAGAEAHIGSLDDLDSLRSGAAMTDGVIHTAFIHDFSKFAENCETDRRAIEAIGATLAGSTRPMVITSGTSVVKPAEGKLVTEDDAPSGTSATMPRIASEEAASAVTKLGVNISVVRLPPSVHDNGDYGFVPMLINVAREKGAAAYIGDGTNRWPAVHRLDAARLFRLALERAAPYAIYNGVGDEGIPMKEIQEMIGTKLHLPVKSITPDEAAGHFTWMAYFAGLNVPASSTKTQQQLGWKPTHKGLIEDLETGDYFTL